MVFKDKRLGFVDLKEDMEMISHQCASQNPDPHERRQAVEDGAKLLSPKSAMAED
jgi:hypothetical protein